MNSPSLPVTLFHTVVAAAFCLVCIQASFAQTASEVAERDLAPAPSPLNGSIFFSGGAGLTPPPGAEELTISLSEIDLRSGFDDMAGAEEDLRERLVGKRVPVSELFAAANALETAYAEAGYVLVRVVLPAQELSDGGSLRLIVVDGFVEHVDLDAVPEALKARMREVTLSLIEKRLMSRSELERSILLAGDTYGVGLDSALASGEQPGGTVVVFDADYQKVTGFVSSDNHQSDALGTFKLDTGIEFNSAFGRGEVVYGRLSFLPENLLDGLGDSAPQNRTLAVGTSFPIGPDGLLVNLETSLTATAIDAGSNVDARQSSRFRRHRVQLTYPVTRSVRRNLDAHLGGKVSLGIDALGARTKESIQGNDTALSQAGADAKFTKFELHGSYAKTLGDNFFGSLTARAQYSFGDPLLTSERFGIVGSTAISGFDNGTLSGDAGWVLRAELSRPYDTKLFELPGRISPYAFAALGEVYDENPVDGDEDSISASTYGIGLDVNLARDPRFSYGSVRIEFAQGRRHDDDARNRRLSIRQSLRF